MCNEIIVVYSENETKPKNRPTLHEQNTELLNVKAGGTSYIITTEI
jgi:hypothetical protein